VHPFDQLVVYSRGINFRNQNNYLSRVRKLSAILLIILFSFSQYTRQLSNLECKFSNTFKSDAAKCDCEKKASFGKQGSDQSPISKTHTHIHLDEFFSMTKGILIDSYFKIFKPASHSFADESEGNSTKPWQPPKV
jgi:hypothetical protein